MVFCPSWVGDVVMAIPTLDCIRKNYPDARIIGVIKKYVSPVVMDGPWFNEIIEYSNSTAGMPWQTIRTVRALRPDTAILMQNSIRSALTARLGKCKKIYGYKRDARSFLLNGGPRPIRHGKKILPIPMVDYYLEICRRLGLEIPGTTKSRLFISDSLQQRGDSLIRQYGITEKDRVIGLNPGARFGASKCWPPEYFAELAGLFESRLQSKILLFVGPGEDNIAKKILDKKSAQIINTGPDNVDLALLKPLIKRCQLLITNDTGPRHFAVALDVPVAVIMGPTDPRYTASNLRKTVVLRQELDCSPCHRKSCPTDHRCMTEITPKMVFDKSKSLLEKLGHI